MDIRGSTRFVLPTGGGCLLLACLLLGQGGPGGGASAGSPLVQAHYIMGTIFEITLYSADPEAARRAMAAAFDEINRIDRKMSGYKPESELSRMNRQAWKRPFKLSHELYWITRESIRYANLTGGAFDITVSPLLKLWGFYRNQRHLPNPGELRRARSRVGYRQLILDDENKTILFARPGIEVDLGGIAKGYAIDRAVDILRRRGDTSALLSAGGSTIFALGRPPTKAYWRVGIKDPMDQERTIAVLKLRDQSVSTSGHYEKFFRINGKTYGHIFDPRTGQPVQGMYSTTVVAPQATQSDALSTSVFVLGFERGIALLDRLDGVEGLMVGAGVNGRRYHIEASQGLEGLLERSKQR